MKRLFVFGFGDSAQALARRLIPRGWSVAGSIRRESDRQRLEALGVTPVMLDDASAFTREARAADTILVTAPPDGEGCPGYDALRQANAAPRWLGYLSTTGVYGDRHGGWVFENSALTPKSLEGVRRVAAETEWLTSGLPVAIFRLPGIYGPGRSALDRLRAGDARRIVSPGQVFSRIHLDDLAAGLEASIDRPRACGVYNLCDDEPAPNSDVIAYAAGLLGVTPPPEIPLADANLSPAGMRFYAESKRVSNARAKAELGWLPAYPTYREGLAAIVAGGG